MVNRNSKRFDYTVLAYFGIKKEIDYGYIKNISFNGIMLETSFFYPVNTTLYIKITDKDNPSHVRGVIKWVKEYNSDENELRYEMGITLFYQDKGYEELIKKLSNSRVERRKHVRINKKLNVVMVHPKIFSTVVTKDISVNGAFIAISGDFKIGEELNFRIVLPYGFAPILVTGKIVSIITEEQATKQNIEAGIGVEIIDFLPNQKPIFVDFINQLHLFTENIY